MSVLPPLLRKLPHAFYIIGAVSFVWTIANGWMQLGAYGGAYPELDGLSTYQKSATLFMALQEGAYMVANGAIIHALISIYDRLSLASAKEAAE